MAKKKVVSETTAVEPKSEALDQNKLSKPAITAETLSAENVNTTVDTVKKTTSRKKTASKTPTGAEPQAVDNKLTQEVINEASLPIADSPSQAPVDVSENNDVLLNVKTQTPEITMQTQAYENAQTYAHSPAVTANTDSKDIDWEALKHFTLISDFDAYLFKEGNHYFLFDKLGAHCVEVNGIPGVFFAVWAPNAENVSVVGDFNQWDTQAHKLYPRWDSSGIWEAFVPYLGKGERYKYYIESRINNFKCYKSDPYAIATETPPLTSSVVWDLSYPWQDDEWMRHRWKHNSLNAPFSIYEVHLGSFMRAQYDNNRSLSYRELTDTLVKYVAELGFTHVELMPIMEHPFFGSWGYQTVNYFAPTHRYGEPQDFMYLIDQFHRHGIGVILDWTPAHFPGDEHGLIYFDGTNLYEHGDPQKGFHPDWKSYIYNYGRSEVKAFLISSAMFWLKYYHIDGLRVDGVASMLYLDYSRKEGEWSPNKYGGNENLEAVHFLKALNETIYTNFPDVQTIAEESTSWPQVSRPVYAGGLGFGMKWNMGWMHDTLRYFSRDSIYRKYHQNELTFFLLYAHQENFVLSLSHDEVVHGKKSLLDKMPGDVWQKFANLRLLYAYQYSQPGKKMIFMGSEFGQWNMWNHDSQLDWHLLEFASHKGVKRLVTDLNAIYKHDPVMHQLDFHSEGFKWLDFTDEKNSIISYLRRSFTENHTIIVVCNFSPSIHTNYRVGVPYPGFWREILNTDSAIYGGSNVGNGGGRQAEAFPWQEFDYSIQISVPPLAAIYFVC